MDQVKMELKEEVMREDPSTHFLPEPLMVILSPPPPFLPVPGEPVIPWDRWRKSFEQYLEALSETSLADSSKCALLQNCLGHEGQHVYATLVQGEASYAAAVSALTIHFSSVHNPQMYRFKFRQRIQRPGESVEQFISALEELVKPCNFGDLEDEHILDQLIDKTNCIQLKERLLTEQNTLTLANALIIGKQVEYALAELESPSIQSVVHEPEAAVYMDNENHPVQNVTRTERTRFSLRLKNLKTHDAKTASSLSGPDKDNDCNYDHNDKQCYDGDASLTNDCSGNDYGDGDDDSEDEDFGDDDSKDKDFEVGDETDEDYDSDAKSNDKRVGGNEMENENYANGKDYCGDGEVVSSTTKRKGHFCPICIDRSFKGPNKLARHMRKHTKEKPFSCPVCAKTFTQSYHMSKHLRVQHGSGDYICSECGESLGSWAELKSHRATHPPEELPCPKCDKKCRGKKALLFHIKAHNRVNSNQHNPRRLICDECGKMFAKTYRLKRHMATHDKSVVDKTVVKERQQCPECEKSYAHLQDLKKHLEIHQKEKSNTCLRCDRTFNCPEELEKHMEIHGKPYLCTMCGRKFKFEFALKKHELVHKEHRLYCSLCDKQFYKASHFERHQKVHTKRETSKCPYCEGVFLQLKAFKKHLRTHIKERPYQCSCCVESFTQNEDLELHCLKHRKFKREKPYSCTRCEYAFSSLEELTAHMSSHKGEQALKCPNCTWTFLNKSKLEKHMTIHTGERPHLCPICGRGYPSTTNLNIHMRCHTGEKPYKCSHCSKTFTTNTGLSVHKRHHMAVRPSFSCPDCGRTYGRMTELKMHQRFHTGDKAFLCTVCSKRFVSKHKLSVHMRIHTGERPYSCSQCGQTFTQAGDRNRHMSKYH